MKLTKILLLTLILASTTMNVFAITASEASNEQYLLNQGYSKETVRMVNLQKHQVRGEEAPKNEPKTIGGKLVRMFVRAHAYLDPAVDTGEFGANDVNAGEKL